MHQRHRMGDGPANEPTSFILVGQPKRLFGKDALLDDVKDIFDAGRIDDRLWAKDDVFIKLNEFLLKISRQPGKKLFFQRQ